MGTAFSRRVQLSCAFRAGLRQSVNVHSARTGRWHHGEIDRAQPLRFSCNWTKNATQHGIDQLDRTKSTSNEMQGALGWLQCCWRCNILGISASQLVALASTCYAVGLKPVGRVQRSADSLDAEYLHRLHSNSISLCSSVLFNVVSVTQAFLLPGVETSCLDKHSWVNFGPLSWAFCCCR